MGTHIEHFLNELNKDLKQADKLAETGYEKDELRDLVTNVGASTEVFLKTAALPHLSPRTGFAPCINALEGAGVSREDRETLHSLRTIYNESKHEPNFRPSVVGFQETRPAKFQRNRSHRSKIAEWEHDPNKQSTGLSNMQQIKGCPHAEAMAESPKESAP